MSKDVQACRPETKAPPRRLLARLGPRGGLVRLQPKQFLESVKIVEVTLIRTDTILDQSDEDKNI